MREKEWIAVLDFGSQYAQLIARRVREAGVYSEIMPYNIQADVLAKVPPKGLILSGGPASTLKEESPRPDPDVFDMGVPILGICYGLQVGAHVFGGQVEHAESREYGNTPLTVWHGTDLLAGIPKQTTVWMSHGDMVSELGEGFTTLASTPACRFAVVKETDGDFYGVQFHPEVTHTPEGRKILHNFLYPICGCAGDWKISAFIPRMVKELRDLIADRGVVLGLAGGVDSSVAAALLHKALGDRFHCIFVDNGLLRKGEAAEVEHVFRGHFKMNLQVVDAAENFLTALEDVLDPEEKRKIIGRV
ncbi:MAG: glutamine-hydrolyzing GMP synthase, partial [Planctomycetota bacterium]